LSRIHNIITYNVRQQHASHGVSKAWLIIHAGSVTRKIPQPICFQAGSIKLVSPPSEMISGQVMSSVLATNRTDIAQGGRRQILSNMPGMQTWAGYTTSLLTMSGSSMHHMVYQTNNINTETYGNTKDRQQSTRRSNNYVHQQQKERFQHTDNSGRHSLLPRLINSPRGHAEAPPWWVEQSVLCGEEGHWQPKNKLKIEFPVFF
jgi:hypothetical protein